MRLIIITGQTATGKTKLAAQYAAKYNGEIINCDSRQIYKHLNIITGKDLNNNKFIKISAQKNFDIGYYPISGKTSEVRFRRDLPAGRQETSEVKLWLYDIVDSKNYFSSFDYVKSALPVIKKLLKEQKTPIIVGGTYFYLQHLLYNIETENVAPHWKLRKELKKKRLQNCKKFSKN